MLSLLLIGRTVLFGLDVIAHGQVTPGGGFQGGVILSSAPLLIYLCSEYNRTVPRGFIEVSEAIGATSYILMGGACVFAGGLFLQNVLPLGPYGSVISGGMVPLIDLGVGLEVSGGLSLGLLAYLEELMEAKEA